LATEDAMQAKFETSEIKLLDSFSPFFFWFKKFGKKKVEQWEMKHFIWGWP